MSYSRHFRSDRISSTKHFAQSIHFDYFWRQFCQQLLTNSISTTRIRTLTFTDSKNNVQGVTSVEGVSLATAEQRLLDASGRVFLSALSATNPFHQTI